MRPLCSSKRKYCKVRRTLSAEDSPLESVLTLFATHNRRIATAACVLLVVLLGLTVADTVRFFVSNMSELPVTAVKPQNTPSSSAASNIDLASLNLFGQLESDAPVVVDAPETRLNLELQGVFTAENPDESTAIIAERNKTGEIYRVGDRLPGSAVLSAVYDDHILIRRGGRTEKLMFSDAKLRNVGRIKNEETASRRSGNTQIERIRERIAQKTEELKRERASAPGAVIREYIENNRERLNQDPEALLKEIGVAPVASGSAQGYKVSGAPQSMLSQSGLREGDIVLSVNGQPVGNMSSDSQLINQAMEAKVARVEVLRDQRRFFLTVPIP